MTSPSLTYSSWMSIKLSHETAGTARRNMSMLYNRFIFFGFSYSYGCTSPNTSTSAGWVNVVPPQVDNMFTRIYRAGGRSKGNANSCPSSASARSSSFDVPTGSPEGLMISQSNTFVHELQSPFCAGLSDDTYTSNSLGLPQL